MGNGLSVLERAKSKPDGTAATLDAVAQSMLGEFAPDRMRARDAFIAAVLSNPVLIAELFKDQQNIIRQKAQTWFADFARRSPQGVGAAKAGLPNGQTGGAAPETISVGGHWPLAQQGRKDRASGADPINGGGQGGCASVASHTLPPSVDPKSSDGGHNDPARLGRSFGASIARPQSITDIRAAGRAAQVLANSVFNTFRMRDGTPIGDIRYSELDHYRSADLHSAAVLDRIKRHCQPASGTDPVVRLMISAQTLEGFVAVTNAA